MPDRPHADEDANPAEDREPPGGQPPERVEDRPNVGQVSPEDYPQEDRRDSAA